MVDPTGGLRPDGTPASAVDLASPFVTYRHQLDCYRLARDAGWSDDEFVAVVDDLDERVRAVDGTGFRPTPMVELETPLDRPVLAKVETGNVGRSHKARHLFGLLLNAVVQQRSDPAAESPTLAIASCGNAALGAAVVASAADRRLDVFVPTDADPLVVAELDRLGATVVACDRVPGTDGDPCMHRLVDAVAAGAHPFTVQGTMCPEAFDGARTLGLEAADQLVSLDRTVTDLYLQVGGGAFATATMQGLRRGGLDPLPRLHPVQPETAHPYVAAWKRLLPSLLEAVGRPAAGEPTGADLAALAEAAADGRLDDIVVGHPEAMTPWPTTPSSVATGILDDVTYDWVPLVLEQLASGGWPVLASEELLSSAAELAAAQVIPPPDATGAAGLAGALADLGPRQRVAPDGMRARDGTVLVVLSGIDRAWEAESGWRPTATLAS